MCNENFEATEYNLEQIICEVISITNVIAINHSVRLFYFIDENIKNLIFTDVNKLRYVILNVVQYAISSAAANASVDLKISVTGQDDEKITIDFFVKNSLRKSTLHGKLLGAYSPVPSIEDELINSNNLVKIMGGRKIILKENTAPNFTAISFSLSFVKGKPIPIVKPNEINEALNSELSGIVPCRVLLVEDNHSNARVTIDLLTQFYNHDVKWVENGQLAIDAVKNESFDAILMDIQMPVMDGFEATRAIRELGVTTPIIALTAAIMPWAYEECLNCGMDAFVSKPVGVKKLGLLIKNTIEKRKAYPGGFQAAARSASETEKRI